MYCHYICNYKSENNDISGSKNYTKLSRIRISCKQGEDDYKTGDMVLVTGKMKSIEPASNPGQFDSQAYYAGKKISYTMWEPEIVLIERSEFHFQRTLYEIRSYFSEIIAQCAGDEMEKKIRVNGEAENEIGTNGEMGKETSINDETEKDILNIQKSELGSIMRGIVLGDKSDISQDTKNLYQTGGISHILAISAMHLTILGNGLYGILKRFGVPIRVAGIISGAFLTVYGILTGASVATIRALIMFLLNIGAQLTDSNTRSNTNSGSMGKPIY